MRFFSFLLFAALLQPQDLFAHARVKAGGVLVPRSTSDSLKTGPCGGVARTVNAATFAPGALVTVQWEETINHPGRFEFYFSASGDTNWQLLQTVVDNQNGTNDLPHSYSTTLTMPNTTCTACTIQMIQVMTENPNNPSNYYSCSDIRLQSAGAPPPVAPGPTGACE